MKYLIQSFTDRIEMSPEISPIGSIIWLHGLGAHGEDFMPAVQELNLSNALPLRFIFPHAPRRAVTINGGAIMPAWFDIFSLESEHELDTAGILQSVQTLQHYIENEKNYHIPSEKIVLAGFSQGAVIALLAGLTFLKSLAGIMVLSGYLPTHDGSLLQLASANQKTPIFVGHGTYDDILPITLGDRVVQFLEEHQYQVDFHRYPMPHTVCSEELRDIKKWLLQVFNVSTA